MNTPTLLLSVSVGILILFLAAGAFTWLTFKRSERRWDLLCVTLLAAMFAAFSWQTIIGAVYQPADGGDLVSFLFPIYRFAARTLNQGNLPLWNPHQYGGAPFIGDIQAGFLYPPTLLLFLLNPDFDYRWMQFLSIGHLWWAGLGVYVLVRTIGFTRPAALLAALAFGLCDIFFIHIGNLNLNAVLSWSGWVLASSHRALSRRNFTWAGTAAALFAVANYAGHAQSSFFLGIAVAIYSIGFLSIQYWECLSQSSQKAALRQTLAHLWIPLALFILTAFLSAPLLLPSIEMLPFTQRGAFEYQDTVSYSLEPGPALIGLLTPGFFGRGPWDYWGEWDRVELPYAGLVTLLFALGAFLLPMPNKWRRLIPWVALGLFGFIIALGGNTPLHGWLTRFLPFYGSFRAPARGIVLWALALSVYAAFGLDALLAGRLKGRITLPTFQSARYLTVVFLSGPVFLLVLIPVLLLTTRVLDGDQTALQRTMMAGQALLLVAAVWLAVSILLTLFRRQQLTGGVFAGLVLLLSLLELTTAAARIDVSRNDPSRNFAHPEIMAFLREQAGEGEECAPTQGEPCPRDSDASRRLFRIDVRTGIYDLWQPNTAALAGLFDVGGIYNPLELVHWQTLWGNNGGRHTRNYDLLNVFFVLVRDGTPLPEQYTLAYDAPGPLAVYLNPDPLPRAWLVSSAQIRPDQEAVLAELQLPTFEPLHTVVLARQDANLVPAAPTDHTPPSSMEGPVSIVKYSGNEIEVTASAENAGYLVLSEVWYPGWRATVNGAPVPVVRANYALRALPVPEGELDVRIWYAPESWRRGLALFGFGILLYAGLVLRRFFPLIRAERPQ